MSTNKVSYNVSAAVIVLIGQQQRHNHSWAFT